MRVVAGRLRGRSLHVPDTGATRPSSQRLRTSLFDSLGARLADARVLDLYAGSGALGIEALSRGAARAVFVERSRAALAALRRNLSELELVGCSRVLSEAVARAIQRLRHEGERFDLVLLDPPYASPSPADRPDSVRPNPLEFTQKVPFRDRPYLGAQPRARKGSRRDARGGVAGGPGGSGAESDAGIEELAALAALAAPDAWLVAERSGRSPVWSLPGWELCESRDVGESRLDRYESAGESEP